MSPRILPMGNSVIAKNCKLSSGQLRPYAGNEAQAVTFQKVGTIKTIYDYKGIGWFHWLNDVDVVEGPVAGNSTERVFWTGDGTPKKSDNTINGGPDFPTNSYEMGVPAPNASPAVATVGAQGDLANAETRVYLYTYVTAWGEEGPPSLPSTELTVTPDTQTVNITGIAGAPSGAYNFGPGATVRIYRSLTGTNATEYQLVAEIPIGTASYSDTKLTSELSTDTLISLDYLAPPATLSGLTSMPNGIMAGFTGKDLYFSEPYKPHAWPAAYILTFHDNIVAIGAFGNTLVVITVEGPYAVTGTHPADMVQEQLEAPYTCSSKRSLVDIGYSIIYASPDGLMMMGTNGAKLITDDLFTRREWEALKPSSMDCYYYDKLLFCFYDTGTVQAGFIMDPAAPQDGIIDLDFYATAGYTDPASGDLFLVIGGSLYRFDGDAASNLEYTWRSGEFTTNKPVNYGAMQVDALTYPVTANVYADGELKAAVLVTDDQPFRLPAGFKARVWEFEIIGSAFVDGISWGENMADLGRVRG